MNAGLPESHPSVRYYDSDYPAPWDEEYAENFDATTELQGLAHDVPRYVGLAARTGGPVLELCCGTGRVGIPLARAGHAVTGVDLSEAMLDRLRDRLARETEEVRGRVSLARQDVARLDLPQKAFRLAILPFNSLLCITRMEDQLSTLRAAARHLTPGGLLVVDAVNPLVLPLQGDPVPRPFLNRRNVHTGDRYTRFAALGPVDEGQRQELYGWYDEVGPGGVVRRTEYRMHWRPVFRQELELMLGIAGFSVVSVEGGHRNEPFTSRSPKLFVTARRDPVHRAGAVLGGNGLL
ncbi:MAG TPA: class I SAM-dependent methyltransferase [Longimicrobiaceae bacterium]|nr:class I SAM-dependent methyltransferase [Longimicrobiaceae bacterium]